MTENAATIRISKQLVIPTAVERAHGFFSARVGGRDLVLVVHRHKGVLGWILPIGPVEQASRPAAHARLILWALAAEVNA